MSSRRRRRTRPTGLLDQTVDERADENGVPNRPAPESIGGPAQIPDEEIDAEDAATQARVAEEDAALAEVEAEAGVETIPAVGDPQAEYDALPIVDLPPEGPEPDPVDGEPDASGEVENFTEEWSNPVEQEPEFDPEIFERGPLAAGIRMLEALLTEARAGYITAQIGELERVLDEQLGEGERVFIGQVAAQGRTASGLPDVAGAYRALVRARVQAGA